MNNFIELMSLVERLKLTRRTGWLRHGVPVAEAESIADHMYRMSLIAMLQLPDAVQLLSGDSVKVDRQRCVKMALVHDMAECIVGDLTPQDYVTDKPERELAAMH